MDWATVIRQIEDHLCPALKLDTWEKSLYYHLLRLTYAAGRDSITVAIDPLGEASGMSGFTARKALRSLDAKKCISIAERSRIGHLVHVRLPEQIDGVVPKAQPVDEVDLETRDFFKERRYLTALLDREQHRCFYTLRKVTAENAVLDHVVPQVNGGGNGYRNVVVACHDVNALKQGEAAGDFIRKLYRSGVLSLTEMEDRLGAVDALKSGKLVPDISRSGG
jgi:5-methylcytosine-specific restriction endonuclease McrA